MTIQEIERAIAELKPRELARFRQWFEKFEKDAKAPPKNNFSDS
jgi:hypothetical protein